MATGRGSLGASVPLSAAPSGAEARTFDGSLVNRLAIVFGAPMALILLGRVLLSLFTALPLVPPYLYSFDTVNMALALKEFDPTRNQPQPPGYPLFVAEERLFHLIFRTPELTFFAIETLICGLSLGMLYLLGRRMFSARAGFIGAALLFVNPVFWFSTLTSPLRPHLALASIVIAYLCWRALHEEQKYFYFASLALGVGSGFRPELLALLFPLWGWTAWQCAGRRLKISPGVALLFVSTVSWVAMLVSAAGGLAHLIVSFSGYVFSQTQQTSMLLDPRAGTWLRWAGRAVLWNALGVLPWIWTLPFARRHLGSGSEFQRLSIFALLWFLPAFAFHFIVHIGDPDQALNTIPVLCLIGGFCVAAAEQELAGGGSFREWKGKQSIALWIALGGNLVLFFGQFPVPQRGTATGFRGWQSLEDAVLVGTYETSYARVRWVNQMMDLALQQMQELTATNRPVLIVWARDGEPVWRKVSFYMPNAIVYSLDEAGDPAVPSALAQVWIGNKRLQQFSGATPIRVPIPQGARLIWLVGAANVKRLGETVPLQKAAPVYYTDLPANAAPFQWGSFQFIPQ